MSTRSGLEWLVLQVEALYRHDASGRITRFNGPPGDDDAAPLFFFGRAREGNLWRLRADLPDALVRELARLAGAEAASVDLGALPERAAVMRERIEHHFPVEHEWSGAAFRFPESVPRPGGVREVCADTRVAEAFPKLAASLAGREPVFAIEQGGEIVSIAYCATVPGAAAEVGVDTVPAFRGRGFAAEVVSAWARAMQARGVIPLYSAAADNAASLVVARKLGLTRFGSDFHFR